MLAKIIDFLLYSLVGYAEKLYSWNLVWSFAGDLLSIQKMGKIEV